ncbi:MAG: DNA/RNA non-specific endonuclease, partial [Bacteroidales bacterium]|nr:DNA/RNA non-specific endonuclease [Bacteroidales bacterium]
MYRLRFVVLLMALLLSVVAVAQRKPPEPYGPCPTEAQVRWQRMEMNLFCHFSTNIVPQNSDFDGGLWMDLECEVRSWAGQSDTCYVVSGCITKDAKYYV